VIFATISILGQAPRRGRSFRDRLLDLPELNTEGLRDCQIDAIHGIENRLNICWLWAKKKKSILSSAFSGELQ